MKRRRFSPAMAVLVVILIGTLYKVGQLVNPPPPGPPETPKPAPAAPAPTGPLPAMKGGPGGDMSAAGMAERIKEGQKRAEMEKKRHQLALQLNNGKEIPKLDDISPTYFNQHPMGVQGDKQVDQEIAKKKQIDAELDKRMPVMSPAKQTSQLGGKTMAPAAPIAPPSK